MSESNKQEYLTDEQLIIHLNDVVKNFKGYSSELESAIGVLIVGRHIGWKPTYILHNIKTLKKYQNILNLDFKQQMPEVGYKADNSVGWQVAKKVSNFWKLVSGQLPEIKKTKEWKMLN